ncbi:extracellular calcium-sensing receptor [Xenopus laevis]|uniref:Extracellular calcium-sensing receptor n=1 Tax=Xenopus laevis TaxID=8355 RepID=A0A8J1MPP1_XENLA|nr:extracellular calcium-sensing receptor [Xenopus laevis]
MCDDLMAPGRLSWKQLARVQDQKNIAHWCTNNLRLRESLLPHYTTRGCPATIYIVLSTEWIFRTFAIGGLTSTDSEFSCSLPSERISGYLSHPGDIVIGGTFMVHVDSAFNDIDFTRKPQELQCLTFAPEYYQSMQALVFAVEEINSDTELLSNITLGFQILDTCVTLRKAAQGALSMLSGGEGITPNYKWYKGGRLAGVVGDSGSSRSILMAQILGLYRYPQISYFATSPLLSDRYLFPSFFRTIPSDEFQMRGLAQMVSYFGWSWVGLLASDNDYGQYGFQMVKQEITNAGACLAFSEIILTGQYNRNAPYLAQVIKRTTAKVVVVVAYNFVVVVEELLRQNVTGKIWLASESWSTSGLLSIERYQGILLGTIGFAIHSGHMPMFNTYLNSLHPSTNLYDPFIKEFWEEAFSCKWLSQENIVLRIENTTEICTGNEKLGTILKEEYQRESLTVYTAVYAIAWALHNLLNCTPGTGPFHHGHCASISSFYPWQLLHYVKNVNFKTKGRKQVAFDAKGDSLAVYDIVNWKMSTNGKLEQVVIGIYNASAIVGKTFNVDKSGITWINNNTQIPLSKCSLNCNLGFWKVTVPGKPSCCYDCAQCPQDAVECHPCSWDTWPNLQQDRCLPRTTEFLSYKEPLGYSLAATSFFSSLIPLALLGVFYFFRKTPIVRANNYSLSCLLLLSLFLCFLCSLGFIGYPQAEMCLLRQVAFGMVFALCISCVLAKTITVVIAFNATKPGSRLRKWTGVKVSSTVIIICTSIDFCICVTWMTFFPPFPELDTYTKPGFIIVYCNEGSPLAFWCMLGYLGLLSSISFIVAFLARQLPDSFNEAKLITFSMLAFLSVWLSFIPAYLSARGMYTVAMEVFAILCSSWSLVGCIFVPKCAIILFKPNLNSKEHLMGRGRSKKT